MPKILFYIERDLHLPYLVPVMEELKKEPSVQAAFCAPEFIPSSGYKPGRGVPEDKLKQLREKAPVYDDPRDFYPDVTVVGDSCQFLLPEHPGPTVNVGTGLSARALFTRKDLIPAGTTCPRSFACPVRGTKRGSKSR
jgi:hypothetical protein